MGNLEDTIRERLDEMESSVERKRQSIASDDGELRRLYSSLSKRERSIGILRLVLGERVEAKEWFASSTEHNLEAVAAYRDYCAETGYETWVNEPVKIRDAFYTALLSQGQEWLSRTAEEAKAIPRGAYLDTYHSTRPWYDFVVSLATFLRGDRDAMDRHLDELVEFADEFDEPQMIQYRGLARAIRGIKAGDEEQAADGIDDTIPAHEAEKDVDSAKLRGLVCQPAAAMYVLALMHGLDPDINREYVPDALDEDYVEISM